MRNNGLETKEYIFETDMKDAVEGMEKRMRHIYKSNMYMEIYQIFMEMFDDFRNNPPSKEDCIKAAEQIDPPEDILLEDYIEAYHDALTKVKEKIGFKRYIFMMGGKGVIYPRFYW